MVICRHVRCLLVPPEMDRWLIVNAQPTMTVISGRISTRDSYWYYGVHDSFILILWYSWFLHIDMIFMIPSYIDIMIFIIPSYWYCDIHDSFILILWYSWFLHIDIVILMIPSYWYCDSHDSFLLILCYSWFLHVDIVIIMIPSYWYCDTDDSFILTLW